MEELIGLTPDTRYLPPSGLRSSTITLIDTDKLSEHKMLMTHRVSEMLHAQTDVKVFVGGRTLRTESNLKTEKMTCDKEERKGSFCDAFCVYK